MGGEGNRREELEVVTNHEKDVEEIGVDAVERKEGKESVTVLRNDEMVRIAPRFDSIDEVRVILLDGDARESHNGEARTIDREVDSVVINHNTTVIGLGEKALEVLVSENDLEARNVNRLDCVVRKVGDITEGLREYVSINVSRVTERDKEDVFRGVVADWFPEVR